MFLKRFVQKLKNCFKKWRDDMAVVYATLIINGKKQFSDVPALLKEKVRQVLVDLDLEDLAQE